MAFEWYTLWVKPHKERAVAELLGSQEVEAFAPMVKVNPVNPRSAKVRAYFPGYIFIYTDLEDKGMNHFNWMMGVHSLVSFDGEPAAVPASMIRQIEDQLAEIDRAGGLKLEGIEHGDKIRITSGPFEGFEAIFDMRLSGNERVQVLLAFLSQHPHEVRLNSADIEKIN
ncbi:MAG: transcription termination/antitermination protein NusG [Candidatus Promineifilaceae bacterium]